LNPILYDAWYDTPAGRQMGEREFQLLSQLMKRAPEHTLLDVGCGTGYFTRRFAENAGTTVVGLDVDAAAIQFAAKRSPSIQFVVGDGGRLPFSDHAFDAVIAVTSLGFMKDSMQAVGEMCRVARYQVTLGLLNKRSLLFLKKGRSGGKGGYAGACWHSRGDAKALLNAAGYKNVQVKSALFLPTEPLLPAWLDQRFPFNAFGGFLVATGRPNHA
jgi:SAM-dependent methyltransferase